MRYSYLHPLSPQFFFQTECIKHSQFQTFYQPYTLFGSISWWLWRNFLAYRILFSKQSIEKHIPELQLRKILGSNAILAINSGTDGPEQKITVIGKEGNNSFFFKYAQTDTAIRLVENEFSVLNSLRDYKIAPAIYDHIAEKGFSCIKTELFEGTRFANDQVNDQILLLIRKISSLKPQSCDDDLSDNQVRFAHGDFCPWNLMIVDGELKAFDWEMAGYYPQGYDLFTYIFQTSFLLYPKRRIGDILSHNSKYIQQFFGNKNWKGYLRSFAEIKVQQESDLNKRKLGPYYNQLLDYAKRT